MRRKLIKYSALILTFMLLFPINLYLVKKISAQTKRDSKITFILDEFTTIKIDDSLLDEPEASSTPGLVERDKRVAILKAFFRKHESPLYDHAAFIVKISDENSLDYRLIPAISMQESGACKVIPPGSHNCWGWGIYGTTVTRFDSYPEAVTAVATGLKRHYIDKGFRTTEEIMRKYNPSSNGSWAFGVNTFIDVLK